MKIPLGILIPENQTNKDEIQKHLSGNSYIVTVGDRTTEKMIDFDLTPSLQIIDGQEKREKREPPKLKNATELTVKNPAAEITSESISLIKKAFTMQSPVRIFVDGEEDLLVLPTPEIRNKVQTLLDLME
jgi:uncharacterized protein (UPF0218 family)